MARRVTRQSLIALVLLTEAILLLVGLVIAALVPSIQPMMLGGGAALWVQLLVGLIASGALFGAVAGTLWWFPSAMDTVGGMMREVIRRARPTSRDCAVISLAAGVGEEVLFRAALLPLLGPIGSAVIFALAHGMNADSMRGRLLYMIATFVVGLFLGWIFMTFGLIAAVVCHAAYDFIALEAVRRDLFTLRKNVGPRAF